MTPKKETSPRRKPRRGAADPTTNPRTLAAKRKQAEALRLREQMLSYEEIAERLGYSNKGAAWKAVAAGIAGITREPAEQLVAFEDRRIDAAAADAWRLAVAAREAGDGQLMLAAWDRVVKFGESRRRLLGLDAPARQDVTSGGEQVTVVFHPDLAPASDGGAS